MTHRHLFSALFVLLASQASMLAGDTFTEDFEDGTNEAGWSWGTGNESIVLSGGNPGAYLQDVTLVSCCPSAFTALAVESAFTGNYRELGVITVGIDLITLATDFGVGNRPLTLLLTNDNDTPFNFDDDILVVFIGDKNIPDAGAGWTDFEFVIPSQATTVPAGWFPIRYDGAPAGDAEWNAVMTKVDVVEFFYGEPFDIFPFLSWDVGLDNPRITTGSAVPSACCFANFSCELLDEADCVSAGGIYQGEDVPCGADTCIPTGSLGACCDPATAECIVTSEELCQASSGNYQGDDTNCDDVACALPPDPCGAPDAGNCCFSNQSAGCNDEECCNLVCETDPFCCDFQWAGICADRAAEVCQLCGAPVERTVTFKQGTCPAPINLSSFGFVLTVLAGDTDFDVSQIVQNSLGLSRCDGAGGSAVPIEFFTKIVDLNHPGAGGVDCASCGCNENQSSDGIPDLELKFATSNLVSHGLLSLDDDQVTLELTGELNDGTVFNARDCVVVIPPNAVQPANVYVESNVDDTIIEIAPIDLNYDDDGYTDFERSYTFGTPVTLTAPATQGSMPFRQWFIDGVAQPVGQRVIEVIITEDVSMQVVYTTCPGELDGSGAVDAADLALLLGSWGSCQDCSPDLNGDQLVNAADLALLLGAWGPCP